jgi:hypothetical protein
MRANCTASHEIRNLNARVKLPLRVSWRITQMRQLGAVAAMPHVTLQVLPTIAHPAIMSGFHIAGNAAYAEHVVGGFVYTDQTVTSLHRLFDSIRAECYRASESAALIEKTSRQWATGANPLTAEPAAETA